MRTIAELLNIKYPLIQGGMAKIANGFFAACCSNAGALGTIASGGLEPVELETEIAKYREYSTKPFAVNIPVDHPKLLEIINVVTHSEVKIAIVGNGNAIKTIESLKVNGINVFPVVGTPEFVKYYERAGADAIIAEGRESGGHIGRMSTMTLVPLVCDSVKIPVVAAGGIADNRQYKAAFALGACGVQVGTALLVSDECPVHPDYKDIIIKSKGAATTVTGSILKDEVRVINNMLAKRYHDLENNKDITAIMALLKGSYQNAVINGDVKNGSVMVGEVVGQIKELKPVVSIIHSICEG